MNSANQAYFELLARCWHKGVSETNKRTSSRTRRIDRAWFLDFNVGHQGIPLFGNRQYWLHIAAAEVAWQFLGTTNPEFILAYAPKLWSKFVDDSGQVQGAYGYRWQKHFMRNQLQCALKTLQADATDRQCWISAWDPVWDGMGYSTEAKNIPCPVGFHLNRVGHKLNMAVTLRSSDIAVGLPYDVLCYALTLQVLANTLGCVPGHLSFMLCHAHFYEQQHDIVKASVLNDAGGWKDWTLKATTGTQFRIGQGLGAKQEEIFEGPQCLHPMWTMEVIKDSPHQFVAQWKDFGRNFVHPWRPDVDVVV